MLDWLIRGAQVLDGTGADAFPADVGIKDGTIAAVGRLTDVDAAHVLDAQGRTLTPGFLDIHRHTDAALFRPNFGRAELAQGLTTLVGGNCGMSLAPLAGAHAPAVRSYLAPITGAFRGRAVLRVPCGLFCRSGANAANREQRHARGHGDAPRPRRGL